MRILKQLFCKHKWRIITAERLVEEKIKNTKNGKLYMPKYKIGVKVFCEKCGKVHKTATKILTYARQTEIEDRILENAQTIVKKFNRRNNENKT